MSDEQTGPEGDEPQRDLRTIVPFLGGVALIALVVIGIAIANLVSPAEDNVTDADLIGTAAQSLAAASRNDDAGRIGRTTCAGFAIDKSPIAGGGDVVKIEHVHVDGDHATADVTVSVNGTETAAAWQFTRSDEHWLVCG